MGRRLRRLRWVLGALALAIAGFLIWQRIAFDREAWLADYAQLRRHMARSYANLLDGVRRGVDPVALHRRTLAQLEDASTDWQARAAIAGFLAAFDDGHLRIQRTKLSKRLQAWWRELWADDAAATGAAAFASAAAACDGLGFQGESRGLGVGIAGLPGFAALDDASNAFSAGVAVLDGVRVGFLRIPSFDQARYRSACLRAWDRRTDRGACDEDCQDAFWGVAVPDQLLADLAARLDELAARTVDLVVVDLTGNGGGTDWDLPAARLFSPVPIACPREAFVKHRHWTDRLGGIRRDVEQDLAAASSDADRELLGRARDRLARLLQLAAEPCDLEPLWTAPGAPTCSNLVDDEYYACGVFEGLPPGALATARSRDALDHMRRYAVPASHPPPRLAILVDKRTASAAEMFTAVLVDSHAAVALGQHTYGAGCGYTSGGIPAILAHSGLRVEMPDCQRHRADGSNERFGIAPTIPIAWQGDDSDEARRDKLVDALRRLPRQ